MMGLGRDEAAYSHFEALFKWLPEKKYKELYAYDVTHNRYEYLDVTIRRYVHASERNKQEVSLTFNKHSKMEMKQ